MSTDVHGKPLDGIPSNPAVPFRPIDPARYTSREFAGVEARELFPRCWLIACREEEAPEPGDFVDFRWIDQSLIVTRQPDGSFKAFYNSCRHRGTELLCKEAGSVKQFRCPNHAWTYAIDGTLTNVLSPAEFPVQPNYNLAEARCDTWGGFVFVNFDGGAEPLLDYLSPLPEVLARYHMDDMKVRAITRFKMACNWKVAQEAFMEAYHLPGAHPQLTFTHDEVNARYEALGRHSRMQVPLYVASERLGPVDQEMIIESFAELLTGVSSITDFELPEGVSAADFAAEKTRELAAARGIDITDLAEENIRNANGVLIFPNIQLQCYPTETLVWRAVPDGDDPNSCFFERIMLYARPAGAPPFTVKRTYVENWETEKDPGIVLAQDFGLMPKIQRGMRQRGCNGLFAAEHQELRIQHLHDEMDRVIDSADR